MNKRGFTLIEVLAVIVIIGILSILILPNFLKRYNDASDLAMISEENEVVDATRLFIEDYCRHPFEENKNKCLIYSQETSTSNEKYTCLSVLQSTRYIDNIISKGTKCDGFIIYNSDYTSYKAYLKCNNVYQTKEMETKKDKNGNSLLDICSVNGKVENYENTSTLVKYKALNDAFSEVSNNQTIKVLNDTKEHEIVELKSDKKDIKLDLNGKKISVYAGIINNGELDIYNTSGLLGNITSATTTITNNGVLTLNKSLNKNMLLIDTSSNSYTKTAIFNNKGGHLTINDNSMVDSTISCADCKDDTMHKSSVLSYGNLTILGGSIKNSKSSNRYENGLINGSDMTMSGGVISSYSTGLWQAQDSSGVVNISGGTINSSTAQAVNAAGNATMNFSGNITLNGKKGIHISTTNKGVVNFNGGSINGNSTGIVLADTNVGPLNITGGTIKAKESAALYIIGGEANVTITGGILTSENHSGINISSGNGVVTIGKNDGDVNINSPQIISLAKNSYYGIRINAGTFNFYDGIVKSSSGEGHAISGNITNIPDGYKVEREITSGVESAYLKK